MCFLTSEMTQVTFGQQTVRAQEVVRLCLCVVRYMHVCERCLYDWYKTIRAQEVDRKSLRIVKLLFV